MQLCECCATYETCQLEKLKLRETGSVGERLMKGTEACSDFQLMVGLSQAIYNQVKDRYSSFLAGISSEARQMPHGSPRVTMDIPMALAADSIAEWSFEKDWYLLFLVSQRSQS